jgi:hypothetical protein
MVCLKECCCSYYKCRKNHKHCHTYNRTKERHGKFSPRWVKKKKEYWQKPKAGFPCCNQKVKEEKPLGDDANECLDKIIYNVNDPFIKESGDFEFLLKFDINNTWWLKLN